jgi:hypothetical protein
VGSNQLRHRHPHRHRIGQQAITAVEQESVNAEEASRACRLLRSNTGGRTTSRFTIRQVDKQHAQSC